jgi:hypothetical protein
MQPTEQQLLRNPKIKPSSDVIAQALGEAYRVYTQFTNELRRHDVQLEWRYYNDGKAWLAKGLHKWIGVRGGQKEVTVFWLSIWDGFFKVTVYVPEKFRSGILMLPIGEEVKKMIVDSGQMGKLKFFPIVFDLYSDDNLEELHTILNYKKSLK